MSRYLSLLLYIYPSLSLAIFTFIFTVFFFCFFFFLFVCVLLFLNICFFFSFLVLFLFLSLSLSLFLSLSLSHLSLYLPFSLSFILSCRIWTSQLCRVQVLPWPQFLRFSVGGMCGFAVATLGNMGCALSSVLKEKKQHSRQHHWKRPPSVSSFAQMLHYYSLNSRVSLHASCI